VFTCRLSAEPITYNKAVAKNTGAEALARTSKAAQLVLSLMALERQHLHKYSSNKEFKPYMITADMAEAAYFMVSWFCVLSCGQRAHKPATNGL
jgi:hypothetical protein